MPRNPPAKVIPFPRRRPHRARTPGAALVNMIAAVPPSRDPATIDRNMKRLTQACSLLIAEMRAGLWDEAPPSSGRRQP